MPGKTQLSDLVKKAEDGLRRVEGMIDRERKTLSEAKKNGRAHRQKPKRPLVPLNKMRLNGQKPL